MISDAEVITILICFHFNSFRNFKHYYLGCVCQHWRHLFPKTFSYNRFVEVMPRCFVALTMFLKLACFGQCSGISFVDSTCIPVIHNKRLMPLYDKIMLRKRSIIESLNDMLKNVAQLVHTRHRSFHNFLMNLLAALGAYCFFAVKPEVNFDFDVAPSNGQLVLWD